jgi:hypothetical protein
MAKIHTTTFTFSEKKMEITEEKILALKNPELLFSGVDYDSVHSEFKKLALDWHPDRNKSKNAEEVFLKIKEFFEKASDSIKAGTWKTEGNLKLKDKNGSSTYNIKYIKKHPFELGEMYVGNTILFFLINEEYKELFDNAKKTINNFKYASDRMEKEISRYLPQITKTFTIQDKRMGMLLKKTDDLLLLRDVLNYGTIPEWDRHVAWILSTLHNLTCYFEYAGICNNDISLDTYFISPKYHSGVLLGGWWYSTKIGEKLKLVPTRTYELIPPDVKRKKISTNRIDLELVRSIGRELLGDESGVHLLPRKAAPEAMVNWLRSTSTRKAVKDYKIWGEVLAESFGPRKYVTMDLTVDKIYPRS